MLKQIQLRNQLRLMRAKQEEQRQKRAALQQRETDLTAQLDGASTDEALAVLEEDVTQLTSDVEALDTEMQETKDKVAELETAIAELEANAPSSTASSEESAQAEGRGANNVHQTREGYTNMKIRRPTREYLEHAEVRAFYTQLRDEIMTKRALGNAELIIPEVVLDRIRLAIGDYSNLLPEVETVQLHGPARAILDGAIPEAIWTEMTDEVKEMETAFRKVEVDGYKVGGFVPVANSILEDSMINLASYIEDRIARAIAKAIDKAILIGKGAAGKQPMGIIPSIHEDNVVEVDGKLATILSKVGLIDTGEDFCGEVIAVMKRKTYYERILPQTVVNTSDGRQVVQGVKDPNIAGLRVVFSQYAPVDAVILGEFKRYLLSERAGTQLARSEHVRFIADQTVFKGTARYDGKPIDIDDEGKTKAFAKLVLKAVPIEDEEAA